MTLFGLLLKILNIVWDLREYVYLSLSNQETHRLYAQMIWWELRICSLVVHPQQKAILTIMFWIPIP